MEEEEFDRAREAGTTRRSLGASSLPKSPMPFEIGTGGRWIEQHDNVLDAGTHRDT